MFSEMPKPGDPEGEPLVIKNQCLGTSRDGDRCKNAATFGMNVCYMHGGKAPQTLASQARRFKEAAGDAMNNLMDIANNSADEGVKLRANIAILDRTGHGPSASLKVGHEVSAAWTAWATNEEIEQLLAIRERSIARMEAGEPALGEVREFDVPLGKYVWLPKSERPTVGEEVIEAVLVDAQTEGQ